VAILPRGDGRATNDGERVGGVGVRASDLERPRVANVTTGAELLNDSVAAVAIVGFAPTPPPTGGNDGVPLVGVVVVVLLEVFNN
jgi:hypothetical protein